MIAQPYPGGPFYANPALIAPMGVRAVGVPATSLPEAQPLLPPLASTLFPGAGLTSFTDPKTPVTSWPFLGAPLLQNPGLLPVRLDGLSTLAPTLLQPNMAVAGLVPQQLAMPLPLQAGGFLGVPQLPLLKPALPALPHLGAPVAPGLIQAPLIQAPALAPMPSQQAGWPVVPGTTSLMPHLHLTPPFC